jgi:hypothetical protein
LKMRRPRFSKKMAYIAIGVLLVGIVIAYGVHQLNSPATGTISKVSLEPETLTDSTSYSTLNTSYYSLLYPSNLSQNYHAAQGGALEYNYFNNTAGDRTTTSLEVYAKPLPQGGITLDGDYKAYVADSKLYKAGKKVFGNDIVDIFSTEANGKERNALWEHGRYLLVIKLHGVAKNQDIDQQLNTILGSVRWLKQ